MGWVEAFKYYVSHFNTNETLTEFLFISKDRNQNLRHQLMFHVCESSCMQDVQSTLSGGSGGPWLWSPLWSALRARNVGPIARGKSRLVQYSDDETPGPQPSRESLLVSSGGRASLGLAQNSLFRWKPLAQLLKQPVTATSLSVMMVLMKISSSLLQVVSSDS